MSDGQKKRGDLLQRVRQSHAREAGARGMALKYLGGIDKDESAEKEGRKARARALANRYFAGIDDL